MNNHTQLLAVAKEYFAFLTDFGFRVSSEKEGRYTSFHETVFDVRYTNSVVEVQVQFYDLQLDVVFAHGAVTSTYLFIYKYMFSNASGFAGNMFSDVPSAIAHIAADIQSHYGPLLSGDRQMWQKLDRLASAPKPNRPYLP